MYKHIVLCDYYFVIVTAGQCGHGGETYNDGEVADVMEGFTCTCNAAASKFDCTQNNAKRVRFLFVWLVFVCLHLLSILLSHVNK